jgi:hypothetical protein
MKSNRLLLVVSVSLLAGSAVADDTAAVKKQLTQAYAQIASLTQKKNIKGMEALMKGSTTIDFKYEIAPGKVIELKQALALVRAQLSLPGTFKTVRNEVQTVTRNRNAAIAHVVSTIGGTVVLQGKSHTFSAIAISDDTWVNVLGVWKLKYIKTRKSSQVLDGKPAPSGL